jgi:hypothetical protein
MDKQDIEVIESLSEPAKKLFYSLDRNSQKRILKQAKELAAKQVNADKEKKRIIKKDQIKREQKKVNQAKNKIEESKKAAFLNSSNAKSVGNAASSVYKGVSAYQEAAIYALGVLLLGQSESEKSYGSEDRRGSPPVIPAQLAKSTSKKANSMFHKAVQKRQMRKEAQRVRKVSEKSVKAGAKAMKQTAKTISSAMSKAVTALAANPITWVVLAVVIVVAIIAGVIGMIVGGAGAAENADASSYQAQVSDQVEGYRDLVKKYCEKYEIDDYVDLCLAMIQQESSGNPPDVMQTEQSYYNTNPPIDSAEESIDCGTHELSDCLKKAKCKDSSDINAIKLAIQGYNFGNGYIDWALKHYGGYSRDNAVIFSNKMKAQLHVSGYGDVDYVPHVLRYYIANPDTKITNESADKILKELKENNEASAEVWKVIEKGASLIGKVNYSMDKRQGDGRDNPTYLDCSSFSAWALHKSGITSIPYGSTDIDLDYLQALKVAGINRISIGVQSLQNNELLKIHRADNIEKIMETIVNVKKCGFYNINTDLIYGLPEQTQESWIDTLQKIIDLGVTTVTIYPLVKKNNLRYDDTCMMTQDKYLAYDLALELLKENKYEQFTFVSFSKCKNGCRHEESFFAGNSTIGFGAGARSYFENVHYCNNNTSGKHASEIIKEYLQNDYSTSVESVMLNPIEKKNKKVLLGLLLTGQGAYIEDFDKDLGQYLLKNKLAYVEQEYIKLTDKGLKYSSRLGINCFSIY